MTNESVKQIIRSFNMGNWDKDKIKRIYRDAYNERIEHIIRKEADWQAKSDFHFSGNEQQHE